ncbi:MAG: hypothetical protein K6A36_07715, partial [Paludibacteraceae bacterium]|nr:hypothetical protein [Paludibacteraceae bacterium]
NPASYGTNDAEWPYPLNGKRFFTSNSTPSATSMQTHTPTGVDICFIQNDANRYNVKFVVNPQIEGPSTLTDQASYRVSNVPSDATIKWTYKYNSGPYKSVELLFNPISFVNGNTTTTVTVERGKYPGQKFDGPISPRDDEIKEAAKRVAKAQLPSKTEWVYFSGTATLTATITCGGYSYVINKNIELKGTPNTVSAIARAPQREANNEGQEYTQSGMALYRLVYENPVISTTANIRIEKLVDNEYVPYRGNYTLSLVGDRIGLFQQSVKEQPNYTLDCGNIPVGVYQLVLNVDGKIVATSKMLKLN